MQRIIIWLGLGMAALLALPGCDKSADTADQAVGYKVLHRGNGGDPGSLDPAIAEDIHAFNVLTDMYEGLLAEAADGSLVPGVAESWTVSDDGLVYRFLFRQDARWSNGDPVVAADFVRAFRHVASPQTASALSFLLEPIRNFRKVVKGETLPNELGVEALADRELLIRLATPSNHWLSVLALPIAFPRHAMGADSGISNGAFTLLKREINGPIRLQRNEQFWNRQNVAIDEVVFYPIVDPMAEFNMYRAGELDITQLIPSEMIAVATEEFPGETRIAPSLALYYLAFDLTETPFDNPQLRQALSMAIDREQLVTIIGRGELAAYGIVPPGVAAYQRVEYDWKDFSSEQRQQRARQLYRAAGYSAEKPLRIKLTYDAGGIHETIALATSAMWHEVLGVDATLDKREWQYFLDTREQRAEWDVMRFSWFGDYNAASTFLEIFESGSPQNLPRYANADYDRLLAEAASETNVSRSTEIMKHAESLLIDDYPVAPLYFFVSKHMVKPYVVGFENNVMDRHPSRYLRIVRDQVLN